MHACACMCVLCAIWMHLLWYTRGCRLHCIKIHVQACAYVCILYICVLCEFMYYDIYSGCTVLKFVCMSVYYVLLEFIFYDIYCGCTVALNIESTVMFVLLFSHCVYVHVGNLYNSNCSYIIIIYALILSICNIIFIVDTCHVCGEVPH